MTKGENEDAFELSSKVLQRQRPLHSMCLQSQEISEVPKCVKKQVLTEFDSQLPT